MVDEPAPTGIMFI